MSSFGNIAKVKSKFSNYFSNDDVISKLEYFRQSKFIRQVAFAAALAIFSIGLIACFLSVPDILSRLKFGPFLMVLFIGVPLTIILNAIDVVLTGRLIEQRFKWWDALKISVFGTAANMLPVPGGAVVRIAALKDKGAGVGEGTRATLAAGFIWLGVSFIYSGVWMVSFAVILAALTILAGIIALALGIVLSYKTYGKSNVIVQLIILKITATFLISIKLIFCVWAIGTTITFPEAATMTAADVIGSAVMIVPAGLGVNEGMSAILAQVAGLAAATGFLAALTNRLATLIALCPITVYLYFKKQNADS